MPGCGFGVGEDGVRGDGDMGRDGSFGGGVRLTGTLMEIGKPLGYVRDPRKDNCKTGIGFFYNGRAWGGGRVGGESSVAVAEITGGHCGFAVRFGSSANLVARRAEEGGAGMTSHRKTLAASPAGGAPPVGVGLGQAHSSPPFPRIPVSVHRRSQPPPLAGAVVFSADAVRRLQRGYRHGQTHLPLRCC